MKIITFFSETHRVLHDDFFAKSVKKLSDKDLILESHLVEQTCPSGDWCSDGWLKCMSDKLRIILSELESLDGSIVIYSDCDVIIIDSLIEDIESEMEGFDIKLQDDGSQFCAGFFAFRKNEKVRAMIESAYSLCDEIDDQSAINRALPNFGLSYSTLDFSKYNNVRKQLGGCWQDGMDFNPDKNTIMFHANFTVGVENKKKLLSLVLNKKGICL